MMWKLVSISHGLKSEREFFFPQKYYQMKTYSNFYCGIGWSFLDFSVNSVFHNRKEFSDIKSLILKIWFRFSLWFRTSFLKIRNPLSTESNILSGNARHLNHNSVVNTYALNFIYTFLGQDSKPETQPLRQRKDKRSSGLFLPALWEWVRMLVRESLYI